MMKPLLAATLLAFSSVLAGCLGGGSGEETPGGAGLDEDAGNVDGGGGGGDSPGAGGAVDAPKPVETVTPGTTRLEGIVQDIYNTTLTSASVSLVGTELYVLTDGNGYFAFDELDADTYTLRVELLPYLAEQVEVEVSEGHTVNVTIILTPPETTDTGFLPHAHDLWRKDTMVLLMDDDVDVRETSTYMGGRPYIADAYETAVAPNQGDIWPIEIPLLRDDHRPPIVLPGTVRLVVTVTWDPAEITLTKVGLRYLTAGSNPLTSLPSQASGVPFIIDLAPDAPDHGHQRFTLWQFLIMSNNDPAVAQTTFRPSIVDGPFHIRIEMYRGEVLIDPPHTDYWNGSTSLVVRSYDVTLSYTVTAPEVCELIPRFLPTNKVIVPPGTHQLRAKFHWNPRTLPSGHPGEREWTLMWKPAQFHATQTPYTDYQEVAPTGGSGATLEYVIPVNATMADAYYQTRSNWIFAAKSDEALLGPCTVTVGKGVSLQTSGLAPLLTDFKLEVIADRDPKYGGAT